MISRHFGLSSELSGAITKHTKNQLSGPDSFFNQFGTDIFIYTVERQLSELQLSESLG